MDKSDAADLTSEALAGACAAVVVALALDKSGALKELADKVPRLGWKPDDHEHPPILARLIGGALATIIFRSVFSVTRSVTRQAL